jgi:hypothetical protein
MYLDEKLEQLRRAVLADPSNEGHVQRYRNALDRIHGRRPVCQRCHLSCHMVPGRVMTKHYHNWTEAGLSKEALEVGFKETLHLVGWRCRICNIITLCTVELRDHTFDWVNNEM